MNIFKNINFPHKIIILFLHKMNMILLYYKLLFTIFTNFINSLIINNSIIPN